MKIEILVFYDVVAALQLPLDLGMAFSFTTSMRNITTTFASTLTLTSINLNWYHSHLGLTLPTLLPHFNVTLL